MSSGQAKAGERVIKVGPIFYDVVEVDGLRDDDGAELDGHILNSVSEIRIEASLGKQAKRQVIWHEILHALLTQAGIREHDEAVLEAISFGVYGVLIENDWRKW